MNSFKKLFNSSKENEENMENIKLAVIFYSMGGKYCNSGGMG